MRTVRDRFTSSVVAPVVALPEPQLPKHRVLRDGSTVELRPLVDTDVELLRRLFFRLSPHTVYLRFFQPIHEPRTAQLQHLAAVDHDTRDAIAAIDDSGEVVAVA